jgi:hypothetical protein
MKTHRVFMVATLAGVLVFPSVQRAYAMDPYYQDLLSNMLYGLVLGTPSGSQGNLPYGPYGPPPSDPYGNSTSGPYGNPTYGPYGNPPSYDPYGRGGGGGCEPARGSYGPSPYDDYRGRDNRSRYQERIGRLDSKYAKAMNRLDRQEDEARAKAYRKSYGDPVRYREQMARIDRKYGYKRYKVERNTARDYRRLSGRY